MKLVAEAHTNKEIAEILHLSEKTVENHRSNAMRKLGMRDRVELVRYAIRKGLIEPWGPLSTGAGAAVVRQQGWALRRGPPWSSVTLAKQWATGLRLVAPFRLIAWPP